MIDGSIQVCMLMIITGFALIGVAIDENKKGIPKTDTRNIIKYVLGSLFLIIGFFSAIFLNKILRR
jgi:hypothetical protein